MRQRSKNFFYGSRRDLCRFRLAIPYLRPNGCIQRLGKRRTQSFRAIRKALPGEKISAIVQRYPAGDFSHADLSAS